MTYANHTTFAYCALIKQKRNMFVNLFKQLKGTDRYKNK